MKRFACRSSCRGSGRDKRTDVLSAVRLEDEVGLVHASTCTASAYCIRYERHAHVGEHIQLPLSACCVALGGDAECCELATVQAVPLFAGESARVSNRAIPHSGVAQTFSNHEEITRVLSVRSNLLEGRNATPASAVRFVSHSWAIVTLQLLAVTFANVIQFGTDQHTPRASHSL